MDMLHRESPQLAGRIEHPSGLPSLHALRHCKGSSRPRDLTPPHDQSTEPEEARR